MREEREEIMARGYLYVVNTDENESMRVSEEELYNLTGHQFDYIENLPDEKSETLGQLLLTMSGASP